MSSANFANSLALVLKSEGGNDDDKADHGGRTSRGITQQEYNAWRNELGLKTRDVWQADQSEISKIYHDEYWEPQCDLLPVGPDYLFFDMAVNAGPNRATILVQRALGVTDDGRMGPVTRQAIRNANPKILIANFSAQKVAFYKLISTNPGQRKFLNGWLNRVSDVQTSALAMLKETT